MGNKSSKSKNSSNKSSDSNNNISTTSVNMNKKKKKWFIFSIKKNENAISKNKIRESKRKHSQIKKNLAQIQPPQPPKVLAPKPGTSRHIATMQDYEAHMIERIQQQLVKDSQAFMLNQLMLSTQFYGNYLR